MVWYFDWSKMWHYAPGKADSKSLINDLRNRFVDYSAPEEMSCDGGSTFASGDTGYFLKRWGVKLLVSSIGFAQSNG